MNQLLLSDWLSIITGVGTIVAIIVATKGLAKSGDEDVAKLAEMRSDIKHIKETVDEFKDVPNRLTKVEESAKQAHKRIDTIEKKI